AHIYRGEGKLQAALQTYRRLLDLDPRDAAARSLCAVLSGNVPSTLRADGPVPAPVVVLEKFLSPQDHDELLDLVSGCGEELEASKTKDNRYQPNSRASWHIF